MKMFIDKEEIESYIMHPYEYKNSENSKEKTQSDCAEMIVECLGLLEPKDIVAKVMPQAVNESNEDQRKMKIDAECTCHCHCPEKCNGHLKFGEPDCEHCSKPEGCDKKGNCALFENSINGYCKNCNKKVKPVCKENEETLNKENPKIYPL